MFKRFIIAFLMLIVTLMGVNKFQQAFSQAEPLPKPADTDKPILPCYAPMPPPDYVSSKSIDEQLDDLKKSREILIKQYKENKINKETYKARLKTIDNDIATLKGQKGN